MRRSLSFGLAASWLAARTVAGHQSVGPYAFDKTLQFLAGGIQLEGDSLRLFFTDGNRKILKATDRAVGASRFRLAKDVVYKGELIESASFSDGNTVSTIGVDGIKGVDASHPYALFLVDDGVITKYGIDEKGEIVDDRSFSVPDGDSKLVSASAILTRSGLNLIGLHEDCNIRLYSYQVGEGEDSVGDVVGTIDLTEQLNDKCRYMAVAQRQSHILVTVENEDGTAVSRNIDSTTFAASDPRMPGENVSQRAYLVGSTDVKSGIRMTGTFPETKLQEKYGLRPMLQPLAMLYVNPYGIAWFEGRALATHSAVVQKEMTLEKGLCDETLKPEVECNKFDYCFDIPKDLVQQKLYGVSLRTLQDEPLDSSYMRIALVNEDESHLVTYEYFRDSTGQRFSYFKCWKGICTDYDTDHEVYPNNSQKSQIEFFVDGHTVLVHANTDTARRTLPFDADFNRICIMTSTVDITLQAGSVFRTIAADGGASEFSGGFEFSNSLEFLVGGVSTAVEGVDGFRLFFVESSRLRSIDRFGDLVQFVNPQDVLFNGKPIESRTMTDGNTVSTIGLDPITGVTTDTHALYLVDNQVITKYGIDAYGRLVDSSVVSIPDDILKSIDSKLVSASVVEPTRGLTLVTLHEDCKVRFFSYEVGSAGDTAKELVGQAVDFSSDLTNCRLLAVAQRGSAILLTVEDSEFKHASSRDVDFETLETATVAHLGDHVSQRAYIVGATGSASGVRATGIYVEPEYSDGFFHPPRLSPLSALWSEPYGLTHNEVIAKVTDRITAFEADVTPGGVCPDLAHDVACNEFVNCVDIPDELVKKQVYSLEFTPSFTVEDGSYFRFALVNADASHIISYDYAREDGTPYGYFKCWGEDCVDYNPDTDRHENSSFFPPLRGAVDHHSVFLHLSTDSVRRTLAYAPDFTRVCFFGRRTNVALRASRAFFGKFSSFPTEAEAPVPPALITTTTTTTATTTTTTTTAPGRPRLVCAARK